MEDKAPSPYSSARGAQLNRQAREMPRVRVTLDRDVVAARSTTDSVACSVAVPNGRSRVTSEAGDLTVREAVMVQPSFLIIVYRYGHAREPSDAVQIRSAEARRSSLARPRSNRCIHDLFLMALHRRQSRRPVLLTRRQYVEFGTTLRCESSPKTLGLSRSIPDPEEPGIAVITVPWKKSSLGQATIRASRLQSRIELVVNA